MKNYFYGLNVNARSHYNNVAEKSILFGNNYNHVRNSGVDGLSNRQSLVSQQTVLFAKSDGSLNSANARTNALNTIIRDNPNVKIDPEAFKALASGDEVRLKIDLEAPERRNLFIGLSIAASQLIGGLAGAAYSQQLGAFAIQRAQEDAGFVTEHGGNFKLNPFGGAEYQAGRISVVPITKAKAEEPIIEPKRIEAKAVEAKFESVLIDEITRVNVDRKRRSLTIKSVDEGRSYEGDLGVKNHDGQQSITGGKSAAEIFTNGDPVDKPVTSKGNRARGSVDGILVTQGDINNPLIKRAVNQYLGAASLDSNVLGLIQDDKLRGALVSRTDNVDAKGNKVPTFSTVDAKGKEVTGLVDVFHAQEKGLEAYTGNKADSRIGGQHTINDQKVANDVIKVFTDSNENIAAAINGTAKVSDQTAALFQHVNGDDPELKGKTVAQVKDILQKRVDNGDVRGFSETLAFNTAQAEKKKSEIVGKYANNNAILEATLKSLPDLGKQSKAFQDLLAERLSGSQGFTRTNSDGKQSTITLDELSANPAKPKGDAAKALEADFRSGNLSKASQAQVIETLGGALAEQLNANGIKQANGTAFTSASAIELSKKIGGGDTNGVDPAILNNSSLIGHLTSVGSLIKSSESSPTPVVPKPISENNAKIAGVFAAETKDFSESLRGLVSQAGVKGTFSDADIAAVAGAKSRDELKEPSQQALFDSVAANANLKSAFSSFNDFTQAAGKANTAVASAISTPSAANNEAATKAVGDANKAATGFVGNITRLEDALGIKANATSVGDARRSNPGETVGAIPSVTTPTTTGGTTTANPNPTTTTGSTAQPTESKPLPNTDLSRRSEFSQRGIDEVKNAILHGQTDQLSEEGQAIYKQVTEKGELSNTQKALKTVNNSIDQLLYGGNDPSKGLVNILFKIADDILKKAFADFEYDYGFNGGGANNEAQGGSVLHSSLVETSQGAHQISLGIKSGLEKFQQYDEARKTESLSNLRSVEDARAEINFKNSAAGKEADRIAALKNQVQPTPTPVTTTSPTDTSIVTPGTLISDIDRRRQTEPPSSDPLRAQVSTSLA